MSYYAHVTVGYYLLCEKKKVDVVVHQRQCPTKLKHHFEPGDKFCPKCGSQISVVPVVVQEYMSAYDIMYDGEGGWIDSVSKEDVDWIKETFDYHWPQDCGAKDTVDVLSISDLSVSGESTDGVVLEMPPVEMLSDEIVQRLKAIMHYEAVEVKFGVIVTVS